jgi:hypothetical protein
MRPAMDGVETSWWHAFQDDRLHQLVELALAHNHDLRVATARLADIETHSATALIAVYKALGGG